MTRPFNVLDPLEDIHQSYLLEASAGTGKTFAIENIIVRKLLEGNDPLTLDQIIVVTFTKAAVADLKQRIYKNIRNAYDRLRDQRLDDALQTFHDASIFTIHSFCSRMLQESGVEGGVAIESVGDLPPSLYKRIVTDFIQVIFNTDHYSLQQIELVKGGYSIEDLIVTLISWVKKRISSEELPPLSTQKAELAALWNACGEHPLETIQNLVPGYKELTQAGRWLNTPIEESDFDALLELTHNVLIKITPGNRKATKKGDYEIPSSLALFRDTALRFCSKSHLLSDLIEKCRCHVENYCMQEDLTPFDLLLNKMEQACLNEPFIKKVRQKYKLAIVDEFQDTDPVQWSIFKRLFAGEGQLILVGDPKQSIYGFRQADIYTYQSAAHSLGEAALRSLDTNFRSTPPLVDALNTFFDSKYTPGWIPLPKIGTTMAYQPVKTGRVDAPNEGGLVVQLADSEESLLTAIANTIIEKNFPLNSTAILVKDYLQASRIAKVLQESRIPFVMQKQDLLTETDAWKDWLTILTAIQQPKNRSLVKCALATTFIGFSHLELRALETNERLHYYMERFIDLKKSWQDKGLSYVTERLNSERLLREECLRERLLQFIDGDLYLKHLVQIQDLFLEEEANERLSPQELLLRGKDLQELSSEEDSRLLSLQDHVRDGVRILTIHSSKGLEFDVVFTPGVLQKSSFKDKLIPHHCPERTLVPFYSKDDARVQAYQEEFDAEKMRQFYVALTRAKKWLFVPFVPSSGKGFTYGEAPPVHLFFARMGCSETLRAHDLYARIPLITPDEIQRILPRHPALSISIVEPAPIQKYSTAPIERALTPPTIPNVPGRVTFIESFTSLSQAKSAGQPAHKVDRSLDPIPAGTETGIILHKIFEMIDFANPKPLPFLQGTLLEPWSSTIESLVLQATQYRFPENFSLADVPASDQFREIEFLYPTPSGYIKGVIDLIFCYNNKIHIVDWKSNLLQNYSLEALRESMLHHDYFLQAKLYREAARRYFGDLPLAIDYFFIRGAISYRLEDSDVD